MSRIICPGCNQEGVHHGGDPPRCLAYPSCPLCGRKDSYESFVKDDSIRSQLMRDKSYCFRCAHWEETAQSLVGRRTVITGHLYSPGNRTSGSFLGMAGRRFDIEYLADGHRITTFDLWNGGCIPDHFRDRFPDTAKFLNGAERAEVGDITCWNPSSNKTPTYPLPNGTSAK